MKKNQLRCTRSIGSFTKLLLSLAVGVLLLGHVHLRRSEKDRKFLFSQVLLEPETTPSAMILQNAFQITSDRTSLKYTEKYLLPMRRKLVAPGGQKLSCYNGVLPLEPSASGKKKPKLNKTQLFKDLSLLGEIVFESQGKKWWLKPGTKLTELSAFDSKIVVDNNSTQFPGQFVEMNIKESFQAAIENDTLVVKNPDVLKDIPMQGTAEIQLKTSTNETITLLGIKRSSLFVQIAEAPAFDKNFLTFLQVIAKPSTRKMELFTRLYHSIVQYKKGSIIVTETGGSLSMTYIESCVHDCCIMNRPISLAGKLLSILPLETLLKFDVNSLKSLNCNIVIEKTMRYVYGSTNCKNLDEVRTVHSRLDQKIKLWCSSMAWLMF